MKPARRNDLCRWPLLLGLAWVLCFTARADEKAVSEYQLKSAFIYNFTKYVEWPAAAGNAPGAPFIIVVAGDENFGRQLAEIMRPESVHGHPIVVKNLERDAKPPDCQMLFVSHGEGALMDSLIKSVAGKAVLTVTEASGAINRGAMINLMMVRGSIKMEVNLAEARQAHLEISSYLLKLAKIVEPQK